MKRLIAINPLLVLLASQAAEYPTHKNDDGCFLFKSPHSRFKKDKESWQGKGKRKMKVIK